MGAVSVQRVLVERDAELGRLQAGAATAREGRGTVIVIEAPAGQGKTALLRAFRAEAADAGLRVLTTAGAELGRDFPFGVVHQLFAGELRAGDDERRARLFAGAAELARPALDVGAAGPDVADASFARLHGLFWLAANLAEEQPLALLVDDAHWADAPSLRFLDLLARRIEDLPIVLAVGTRPAEPGAEQELLDSLAAGPDAHVLRPRALSAAGVAALLEQSLGAPADDAFAAAAAETTAGSPLLVREMLRTVADEQLRGRAEEVAALRRALPSNVGRLVVGRLRRLSPGALATARGVAVLGDRARPADVAELAGLPAGEVVEAHAALGRAGLLDADELRFSHPIVREAVHDDLGGARAEWHGRAAAVRSRAGAGPEEVAAHLLGSPEPAGEPWAAEALAAAGRQALAGGEPDVAARHLRRALDEPSAAGERDALLLSLGHAEARAGDPDAAIAHLEQAAAAPDPRLATEAERLRAQVLVLNGRTAEGIEVLRAALARTAGDDQSPLAREVEDDLIDLLAHHGPLRAEYLARLDAAAGEDRPTLLAHLAFVRSITGAPAAEALGFARRALAAPAAGGEGRFVHFYALEALMMAEAAAEAAAALRDAAAMARRLGSRVVAGPLTYMPSSWMAWERAFGDLRRAEELAREAHDLLVAARMPAMAEGLRISLGVVLLDRGDIEGADAMLAELPAREAGPGLRESHAIRARLRLAQGRPEEALTELETEFELERARGWAIGNRDPSRLTHVRALLALGRADEARAAAEAELAIAERRGVPGALARAQLGLALTLDGPQGLEALESAAAHARSSPARRLAAEVIGEHGAALRRAGDRVAARGPLTEARELAHRCGATALEERLRDELLVAGARPRRVALAGADSLTAAERRVAELAAEGLRNREIAEVLFVTLKTVETHLGHIYGKLDIKGRAQLATALGLER